MQTSKARSVKRAENDELSHLKQQVDSLTQSVETLRAQVADQSSALADLTSQLKHMVTVAADQSQPAGPAASQEPAISPELLIVIAAGVTAFLGKKVRIRSAKTLQSPYEIINPWAQQGRVFVQASHNLSRG